MANLIALVGQSGSGKSYSLRNLNPEETIIINVANKPFPWKGWKNQYQAGKNYIEASQAPQIIKALKAAAEKASTKTIVIEDYQYIMAFKYLATVHQKGYDKFNEIADAGFGPVNVARGLRNDIDVIFCCHEQYDTERDLLRIKTSGKLVDSHINLEGMFTVVLFTHTSVDPEGKREYRFLTNDGLNTTAKSPPDMFPLPYIPNDMKYALQCIRGYYEGTEVPPLEEINF